MKEVLDFVNFDFHLPVTDPTWIFFLVLVIILFAPIVLERLRIPHIIGMILAGVVIGEHGFNILARDSSFELFGKVGLYYIMFLAGLEMNMEDFKSIRVKATVKNFREETNMSVITESGSFYTFNVKYAEEPLLLNIEMKDFIHDGSEVNRPNNALDIYLKELGSESPKLVYLISKSVHKDNKRHIKHIGSTAFGIQYLLRGLYTHNGLLYFHTQIRNRSNVPYEVDFVTFKIVDKKVMKRTAIQEQVIFPLRAYDYVTTVAGKKDGRTVFVLDKFTIPSDKVLVVEMHEKSGGRHQTFTVESEDIVRARVINGLKVK